MAMTYRVGADGATVFTADGAFVVCRLRPGHVVVAGMVEDERSAAAEHAATERKRVRGYADKAVHAERDTETASGGAVAPG
jgi:hypothetical protein